MSGRDRCDEVLKLIDDALAECQRELDTPLTGQGIVAAGRDEARQRT